MGTVITREGKRGTTYRAVVKRRGRVWTKTFKKLTPARQWIIQTEAKTEMRQVVARGHTVGSILKAYRQAVVDKKPFKSKAKYHYIRLAKQLDDAELDKLTPSWWQETVSAWTCSPASRTKYLGMITGALKWAEIAYELELDWSGYERGRKLLKGTHVLAKSRPRVRRVSAAELAAIRKHMGSTLPMNDIIDFELELGMRAAEIMRLRWSDLDRRRRMIWVRERKHPTEKMTNHQEVPLLGKSYALIKRQPTEGAGDGRIFPYNEESVCRAFERACKAAGVQGLSFRDLRHEALSRLFEKGFRIQQVAMVSGHHDWKSLQIYTNLRPEDLHSGPAGKRSNDAS